MRHEYTNWEGDDVAALACAVRKRCVDLMPDKVGFCDAANMRVALAFMDGILAATMDALSADPPAEARKYIAAAETELSRRIDEMRADGYASISGVARSLVRDRRKEKDQ